MTEYNRREQARIEKLQGQVETLRELRNLDRAEIERLNIRIRQDAEAALQHLNEIDQFTGSKAALQTEIERLRLICEDTVRHLEEAETENERLKRIQDGTERREAEYLALVEKHATANEQLRVQWEAAKRETAAEIADLQLALIKSIAEVGQLKRERHTTKQMLKDILDKHGYSGWDAARTMVEDDYGLGGAGQRKP